MLSRQSTGLKLEHPLRNHNAARYRYRCYRRYPMCRLTGHRLEHPPPQPPSKSCILMAATRTSTRRCLLPLHQHVLCLIAVVPEVVGKLLYL